jgi:hypothetical protein
LFSNGYTRRSDAMLRKSRKVLLALAAAVLVLGGGAALANDIGREVAIPSHLENGEEFSVSPRELIEHGKALFEAAWTTQEGGGRPLTKGTGAPLSDLDFPLEFPDNFNRVSAPDANACAGCHNAPFGIPGGGGDVVTGVFVLGQRFDFATFDPDDPIPTRGTVDERGAVSTLQSIANFRATLGMFGSGYIEMLARQITEDLQAIRDATPPGGSNALVSKGIDYGTIARSSDGDWDTSAVEGLPATSLSSTGPDDPPNLVIRPFHQAGAVVSLREFTNNAFNHHHGMQSQERFGEGRDPDGDGFVNELTRADITASVISQAILPATGRVMPKDPAVRRAARKGERLFMNIGCGDCHVPSLPLDDRGWVFTEPNPFNPPGNLQVGEAPTYSINLNDPRFPGPRLKASRGVVHVPAFTDLKLHDITKGPDDPYREPLDMTQPAGSDEFFAGNSRFLTRKLWGAANEPPYGPHGKFTTLRQSVLAHAGEAEAQRLAFEALREDDRDRVIEFLKTLQVFPPGPSGSRFSRSPEDDEKNED